MIKQLRYIRERIVNAAWMIRNGEFRSFVSAIFVEIGHRVNDVRIWWVRVKPKKLVHVPQSAYQDPTRVIPPSPRPTRLRHAEAPEFTVDVDTLESELAALRSTLVIAESRVA